MAVFGMRLLILATMLALFPSAAAPSAPQDAPSPRPLTPPADWVTEEDYPVSALRREVQGVVVFTLSVDSHGTTTGWAIDQTSGDGELDAETCRIASSRARFEAALDASGHPVPSHWTSRVHWEISPASSSAADLDLPAPYMVFEKDGRARSCLIRSRREGEGVKEMCTLDCGPLFDPSTKGSAIAVGDSPEVSVPLKACSLKS